MSIRSIGALVIGISACFASYLHSLEMKVLTGGEIKPYTKTISAYFNAAYREAPYFYDASEEQWDRYVQSYAATEKAVVCIAQEGDAIFGIAMGTPLAEAREKYRMGFSNRPNDLNSLFYLGEFAVRPDYRRQGIGTKMYQAFEKAVKEQARFSGICLWQLESEEVAPPVEFFEKQGFERRSDIRFNELWKNVTGTEKVPHPMICWIKVL
jgi:GNAT superfamily N-acetyltransferase